MTEEDNVPSLGGFNEGRSKPDNELGNNDVTEGVKSDFNTVLQEVKAAIGESMTRALFVVEELILKLGKAIEQHERTIRKSEICKAIKHYLQKEIEEGLISEKLIERYCPSEWKNPARSAAGKLGAKKVAEKISAKSALRPVMVSVSAEKGTIYNPDESVLPTASEEAGKVPEDAAASADTNFPKEKKQMIENNNNTGRGDDPVELANKYSQMADTLAEVTATCSNQKEDIQTLKQQNHELEQQLLKATVKPAYEYPHDCVQLQKRLNEQSKLLLPFTVNANMEAKGELVPVIVKVEPVTNKAQVFLDEARMNGNSRGDSVIKLVWALGMLDSKNRGHQCPTNSL
jgi:hypothetical protein